MPGETLDEALVAAREQNRLGIAVTLTHLGENLRERAEADAVLEHYRSTLDRIRDAGVRGWAETVHALPAPVMGLECTLHDIGFLTSPNYSTRTGQAQWPGAALRVPCWVSVTSDPLDASDLSDRRRPGAECPRPNARVPTAPRARSCR